MAISNQIARLQTLRNSIRTKLINIGLLPAASTSATLSECYNVLSSVTGLSAMSYTPTTTAQTIASGQYLKGAQTINAIPSTYIVPTGTSTVTSNSVYDIRQYASVSVNVQPALQSKTVTPTQAVQSVTPDTGIYGLSKVTVNAIPSSYLIPSGTITLSSSGTFDVGSYASADVTVTGGPSRPYVTFYNSYTVSVYNHNVIYPREFYSKSIYFYDNNHISSVFYNGLYGCTIRSATGVDLASVFSSCSSIGDYGFYGAELKYYSVVKKILDNITYIGAYGFAASSYLDYSDIAFGSSITLPECSYIGASAFVYRYLIKYISIPKVESIQSWCFHQMSELCGVYAPSCSIIGSNAFSSVNSTITELYFPICKQINANAFYTRSIQSFHFPLLEIIGDLGFGWVKLISELYFSKLYSIGARAFESMSSLISINFPSLSNITKGCAFQSCRALTTVNLPSLTTITGSCTFSGCTALSTIDLPSLTTITGSCTFNGCTALTTVKMSSLITISNVSIFYGCTSLTSIGFPALTTAYAQDGFAQCTALTTINFSALTTMSGLRMYSKCYNLISIILLGSSVCTLGNGIASMFYSTPISTYSTSAGRFGSVFVPRSLVASYKAATNWTIISSKIVAYEDYFDSNGNPL